MVANVNLDMPILTYDFTDVVAFGAEHSTMGPIVARAVQSIGVTLSPDPIPEEGLFTRSDHYSFVKKGIPAVFLKTGFAGEGKAKSEEFRKLHYHKVSDDMKLPIRWDAAAKFAQVNYLIARELADAAEAPRWYAGNFFGDKFAPDQPQSAETLTALVLPNCNNHLVSPSRGVTDGPGKTHRPGARLPAGGADHRGARASPADRAGASAQGAARR